MAGLSGKKEAAITPYCLQVPYISCICCYHNRAAPIYYLMDFRNLDLISGVFTYDFVISYAVYPIIAMIIKVKMY